MKRLEEPTSLKAQAFHSPTLLVIGRLFHHRVLDGGDTFGQVPAKRMVRDEA
jgi:hypothetical protein